MLLAQHCEFAYSRFYEYVMRSSPLVEYYLTGVFKHEVGVCVYGGHVHRRDVGVPAGECRYFEGLLSRIRTSYTFPYFSFFPYKNTYRISRWACLMWEF